MPEPIGSVYLDQPQPSRRRPDPRKRLRAAIAGQLCLIGIVGLTAAFYLARRGQRVAVVERNRIGSGTSSRSFAWINATSKVADEPYHRLNALGAALIWGLHYPLVDFALKRISIYSVLLLTVLPVLLLMPVLFLYSLISRMESPVAKPSTTRVWRSRRPRS